MKTKFISLDALVVGLAAPVPDPDSAESAARRTALVRSVKQALAEELTDRQRDCLWRRCSGERVMDIARELGITPPTVVKHLHAATRRLQRIFRYYPIR